MTKFGFNCRNHVIGYFLYYLNNLIFFFRIKKKLPLNKVVKSILISNISQIGDVLVNLYFINNLRKLYPYSKIYFLCSSSSVALLNEVKNIDGIIIFDHYLFNRNTNFINKLFTHFTSFWAARNAIKKLSIDIAIESRWHLINSLFLLSISNIKYIKSFSSSALRALSDEIISMNNFSDNYSIRLANLYRVKISNTISFKVVEKNFEYKNFCVLHIEGNSVNQLPNIFWLSTLREIEKLFYIDHIIFTGIRADTSLRVNQFKSSKIINLIGITTISDLIFLYSKAKFVISVDTFNGHLAASVSNDCRFISTGRWSSIWFPHQNSVRKITHEVPCAPCYRPNGCRDMTCLNGIDPLGLL